MIAILPDFKTLLLTFLPEFMYLKYFGVISFVYRIVVATLFLNVHHMPYRLHYSINLIYNFCIFTIHHFCGCPFGIDIQIEKII